MAANSTSVSFTPMPIAPTRGLQLLERREPAAHGLPEVPLVLAAMGHAPDVVEEEGVHAQGHAIQALLEAPQHALAA